PLTLNSDASVHPALAEPALEKRRANAHLNLFFIEFARLRRNRRRRKSGQLSLGRRSVQEVSPCFGLPVSLHLQIGRSWLPAQPAGKFANQRKGADERIRNRRGAGHSEEPSLGIAKHKLPNRGERAQQARQEEEPRRPPQPAFIDHKNKRA